MRTKELVTPAMKRLLNPFSEWEVGIDESDGTFYCLITHRGLKGGAEGCSRGLLAVRKAVKDYESKVYGQGEHSTNLPGVRQRV